MNPHLRTGIWRLADPKISITSVAAMTIGGTVAALEAPLDWFWMLVLGLALFCMEVAKNAWGEIYDYDSGTDLAVSAADRTNFSGGKRVLVDQLLSRAQTWAIAAIAGGMGLGLGALIVFLQAPNVFWLGLASLVLGWSYHGPPLQLVYRGWGELAVVLIYGPALALATYMVQRQHISLDVVVLSVPLGIFVSAFLWVNEFPDYTADRGANKRNLVVILGRQRASRLLPLIYLAGFLWLLAVPWISNLDSRVWWGLLALPTALLACIWTWQAPTSFYRSQPVQPMALLTFVAYPLAVCMAFFLPTLLAGS
jgi:1,4-dihydroxy-2-naphthoate octaprenyltransferase